MIQPSNLRKSNNVELGTATEPIRVQVAGDNAVSLCDGDGDPIDSTGGSLHVTQAKASTATVSQVAVDGSNVQVLAANASRKRYFVRNTGTTILYLREGSTAATVGVYTDALPPCSANDDATGGGWSSDIWTGAVQVIGSGAGGQCVVTEW